MGSFNLLMQRLEHVLQQSSVLGPLGPSGSFYDQRELGIRPDIFGAPRTWSPLTTRCFRTDEGANTPVYETGAASLLQDPRLFTARTPGPVARHVDTVYVLYGSFIFRALVLRVSISPNMAQRHALP